MFVSTLWRPEPRPLEGLAIAELTKNEWVRVVYWEKQVDPAPPRDAPRPRAQPVPLEQQEELSARILNHDTADDVGVLPEKRSGPPLCVTTNAPNDSGR
jgi:hypothetical protein